MVFFEFLGATKVLNYSSHSYVLEDDQILMMPMGADEDDDFDTLGWNITHDKLLEIDESGKKSVWEPVMIEDLAKEGFPVAAIAGYREAYAQNGISHSLVGVAPLPSTMRAIKRLKGKKPPRTIG